VEARGREATYPSPTEKDTGIRERESRVVDVRIAEGIVLHESKIRSYRLNFRLTVCLLLTTLDLRFLHKK
jgi:hypothetical protein